MSSAPGLNKSVHLRGHLSIVAVIVLGVGIIYGKVSTAYFCSYDDFNEVHRTAFEDAQDPSKMFTTPHFNSYKYRPLNRAMNLLTYWAGEGKPVFFRVRNLVFHLLNVILVYALGWLLFRSASVSALGAGFFGLHPLSNQSVIGAVWTNTMAHTGFLLALVLFIISVSVERFRWLWLTASLVCGWLSLLTYDSEIVVFGLMGLYLIGYFTIRGGLLVGRRFLLMFTVISGTLLCSYFLLRFLFVQSGWTKVTASLPSPSIVGKNLLMYAFALLFPIDLVMANEWLHTPLPSELVINKYTVIIFGSFLILTVLGLAVVLWRQPRIMYAFGKVDWMNVVFLIIGMILPLSPVILFEPHPSETYLYLPAAFYGLLLSYGLATLFRSGLNGRSNTLYVSAVVLIVILFSAATWIRNERVVKCAETADRILQSLPGELLKGDPWTVSFANVPGEEVTHRYGFYGFRGVDTIGHGSLASGAVTSALQLVYRNESLSGEVIRPEEFSGKCRRNSHSRHLYAWVHADGRVETLLP